MQGRDKESLYNCYRKNNELEKAFIYTVLENILCDENFVDSLPFISLVNKDIIENALNTVSVQLSHEDYKFPTDNDYTNILNEYNLKRKGNSLSLFDNKTIVNPSKKYKNHVDKKLNMHGVHNNLYNEIVLYSLDVWRDLNSFNLYFRIKPYEEQKKTSKEDLSSYLSKVLQQVLQSGALLDCT